MHTAYCEMSGNNFSYLSFANRELAKGAVEGFISLGRAYANVFSGGSTNF